MGNNITGIDNTAGGFQALFNSTGSDNTATGHQALINLTSGDDNTAVGNGALLNYGSGSRNIAIGFGAGSSAIGGDDNILIGVNAGFDVVSNNIDIGSTGNAEETNTIHIRTEGSHTATFIAGINGSAVLGTPTPVFVDQFGRVGIVPSSARYKRDIHDMGESSDNLMRLRPVAFRYKADPANTQQYGLIAEEVAKVYPELVVNGADGRPDTAVYHVLPAMLLKELQKQSRELAHKDAQIAVQQRQIDALARRLEVVERQARTTPMDRLAVR
jgi:hypothetical protein